MKTRVKILAVFVILSMIFTSMKVKDEDKIYS